MVGTNMLPAAYEEPEPSAHTLDGLVQEALALLSSSNVTVKETIKDVMGTELPLSCTRVLVTQLERQVNDGVV